MEKNTNKRFWSNRSGNDNRGSYYTMVNNVKLPTNTEMDKLDKHNIIYDIDPPIRTMVIELNDKGFKTEGSCAGHSIKPNGFITFKGDPTQSKVNAVVNIMKKYNIKGIKFNKEKNEPGVWWSLTFNSIGIVKRSDLKKQYRERTK